MGYIPKLYVAHYPFLENLWLATWPYISQAEPHCAAVTCCPTLRGPTRTWRTRASKRCVPAKPSIHARHRPGQGKNTQKVGGRIGAPRMGGFRTFDTKGEGCARDDGMCQTTQASRITFLSSTLPSQSSFSFSIFPFPPFHSVEQGIKPNVCAD